MILRIVRGEVAPGRLPELADAFVSAFGPVARATPGLVRFHVAVRPEGDGHRIVVVTFWTSVDAAMAAYGGDLDTPRTLEGLGPHATFSEVAYFEVDETLLRGRDAAPAVLRITVGRVAQGIDVSIQQAVRSRLHELDEGMTEAYVGRRIVGADVEVAFISTWTSAPSDRPLDAPIWPDISTRYDAFLVETFVPLLSGPRTP